MITKPFLYLATSLTHVQEAERPQIAKLVERLKKTTRFLQWAFDPVSWTPRSVKNIFKFDTAMVGYADFVAGVFWSSAGSDGRGAELLLRAHEMNGRGMCIYIREGVKITPFITDMADHYNVLVKTFKTVEDLGEMITNDALGSQQEELWPYPLGQKNRGFDLGLFFSGYHENIVSFEAFMDMNALLTDSERVVDDEVSQAEFSL